MLRPVWLWPRDGEKGEPPEGPGSVRVGCVEGLGGQDADRMRLWSRGAGEGELSQWPGQGRGPQTEGAEEGKSR